MNNKYCRKILHLVLVSNFFVVINVHFGNVPPVWSLYEIRNFSVQNLARSAPIRHEIYKYWPLGFEDYLLEMLLVCDFDDWHYRLSENNKIIQIIVYIIKQIYCFLNESRYSAPKVLLLVAQNLQRRSLLKSKLQYFLFSVNRSQIPQFQLL